MKVSGSHPAWAALVAAFALCALPSCELLAGKGGGTETEVLGRAVNPDGSPVALARVTLRPADYLADLVSTERAAPGSKDTVTDAQGRFNLGKLPAGEYRVEISGSESRGSIHDFFQATEGKGLRLDPDTLRLRGSVIGAFAPDSESRSSSFVQVFGMERLVKADPAGNFILYNLPRGSYAIRCSNLQPFRRDAVSRNIQVASGQQTAIDPVVLATEAKLAFRVDAAGLDIIGLDSTNPLIMDNELWDNGVDNEYVWAKASSGALDLRGNIVTNDHTDSSTVDEQLRKGQKELRQARLAGFAGIPDLVAGAPAPLTWPASGILEDIAAGSSPGSDLIVAEARKATPEKPLLVVVGGPLTTVAQAWLTDPTIASRMVVASVFTYTMQTKDSVANYLVARKCRYVQWGRNYKWMGAHDTSLAASVPLSRMGERVRKYLMSNGTKLPLGDIAPVAYLFRRGLWTGADMVKVSRSMEVGPASDISFDFLDIPASANAWQGYQEEFYAALADKRAYHTFAVPGRLEAEAYVGMAKVTGLVIDSSAGSEGVEYASGSWSESNLEPTAAAAYKVTVRYRSSAGAKLAISIGAGVPVEVPLAPSVGWAETVLPALPLATGAQVLRLTVSDGSASMDWLDFSP